jgi:hypothetical protein
MACFAGKCWETHVKIEVFVQEADKAIYDTPEVWVQVQSDELVDWPRVRKQMTEEQSALIEERTDGKIAGYHPALLDGGDSNTYRFEDWFILKAEAV